MRESDLLLSIPGDLFDDGLEDGFDGLLYDSLEGIFSGSKVRAPLSGREGGSTVASESKVSLNSLA